jgi:hypothetical protein
MDTDLPLLANNPGIPIDLQPCSVDKTLGKETRGKSTWRLGVGSVVESSWLVKRSADCGNKDLDQMLDLIDGRTYWATDRPDKTKEITRSIVSCCNSWCLTGCREITEWQLSKLPKGWLSDFWFYCKNNHPLISIFLADKHYPLLPRDRWLIELSVLAVSFVTAYLYRVHVDYRDWETTLFFYLTFTLFVTVPGILAWVILYNSLLCPCMQRSDRCSW